MTKKELECGCSIDIEPGDLAPKVSLSKNIKEVNWKCPKVWDLISNGNTWGVFQLEKGLGQKYSKLYRPSSVDEMAALQSIIRPGTLDVKLEDGKSLTEHICFRKNGLEEAEPLHESVSHILNETQQAICYQEQCLFIAKEIAGMTPSEGDDLRKCISGDSIFITKRGPVTAKELYDRYKKRPNSKTKVWSVDVNNKACFVRLKDIWSNGIKEVFTVRTNNGYEITCTEDHELFTNHGWKMVKDMSENDFLAINYETYYPGDRRTINKELSKLIGFFLSEGHWNNKEIKLTNKSKWFLDEVRKICYNNFNIVENREYVNKNGVTDIHFKGEVGDFLKSCVKPALSRYKEIPKKILQGTKSSYREFLAGFFSGDGCVEKNNKTICFDSTSINICKNIQSMLFRFGIHSAFSTKNGKYKGEDYLSYRVSIRERYFQHIFAAEFLDIICPSKAKDLKELLKGQKKSNSKFLVPNNIVRGVAKSYTLNKIEKFLPFTLSGSEYGSNLSYEKFRILNNCLNSDIANEITDADFKFAKIKSIKKDGTQEVFDFSIHEKESTPHAFVNGILTHNCIGKKIPAEMKKSKKLFIEGAKKKGIVDEATALKIFEGIEASARYVFNKSHAVAYSYNAYFYSAYIKAHFPRSFYMSKLKFIKTASDSTEIINDAKKMGINIILPDLRYFNSAAVLVGNNILFPLSKIKYVSEAIIDELKSRCTEYDTMPSYKDWLITIFHKINIRAAKSLIYAGALDFMGVPRSKFAADLDAISGLKVDVIRYMRERDGEITDLLKDLLSQGTGKDKILKVSRSKNSVIECIDNLDFNKTEKDIPRKLSNWEREYLGRELSCIDIDKVGNFNCHELSIGHVDGNINIAGIIESFREYRSKKDGKLFGFVNIYDLSGLANNIMIPNKGFDENSKLLYTGNKVFISGKYFPKSGFMMAEKVQQI